MSTNKYTLKTRDKEKDLRIKGLSFAKIARRLNNNRQTLLNSQPDETKITLPKLTSRG